MSKPKNSDADSDSFVSNQRAWLHRNGKPTWMFEPSQEYGELVHITRSGAVYAIIAGHRYGKPFWVARLCDGA